ILNDRDRTCYNILHRNFDMAYVHRKDIRDLEYWKRKFKNVTVDFALIDFNTFTSKHILDWEGVLHYWYDKSRFLGIVDTACFCLTRFKKSREVFGVKVVEEYYYKLAMELGFNLMAVSYRRDCSVVLFSRKKSKNPPEIKLCSLLVPVSSNELENVSLFE
ncbi:unnamed protein product, partial [marine sediment metagenome]